MINIGPMKIKTDAKTKYTKMAGCPHNEPLLEQLKDTKGA
jgi:hypothetical protein